MASRDEGYKFWLNINVDRSMFNLLETAILTESDAQVPGSEFDHKIFIKITYLLFKPDTKDRSPAWI